MGESIRVNFGRPVPLFPLPDTVLLPHAVQPLHIFEPRYCQMVSDCLDQAGQIAMASFDGEVWKTDYKGHPPLRPAVCLGQITEHERISGGRHHILLHGLCRARIVEIIEPEGERLYRLARLSPTESLDAEPPTMDTVRIRIRDLLGGPRLRNMSGAARILELFGDDDVPTHALLELIGFSMLSDGELRYRLLAEPDPFRRAKVITGELRHLDRLVGSAERQNYRDWPKGMSWN